jgi:hypothetical protein
VQQLNVDGRHLAERFKEAHEEMGSGKLLQVDILQ